VNQARAAAEGRFDPALLSDDECRYYYEFLGNQFANPSAEEIAAATRLGGAGYDDQGRLVRRETDGSLTVIA
jgi:hypothetical protein